MGLVYENITLKNTFDVKDSKRGNIKESEIRQVDVRAMVDSGAEMLVISEAIRQALGLDILGTKQISLANESAHTCQWTEPVEVHWKDRYTIAQALVLDGATEVLLGAIPLEGMNVIIDPGKHQLVGAYGEEVIYKVKEAKRRLTP